MKHDLYPGTIRGRAKLWGGLTLATIFAASGAIAIANADMRSEHIRPPRSRTFTCSGGFACLQGKSTGSSTHGIYASSTEANAIQAVTTSTTSNSAVAGYSTGLSGTGIGVYGTSSNGPGVWGNGATMGVNGVSQYGTGVSASSVYGDAVDGSSTNGAGISGKSTSGDGVYGFSTSNYGVVGSSGGIDDGVAGFNNNTSSNAPSGVYGSSSNGPGVYGLTGSNSSYGVESRGNVLVQGEVYTSGSCRSGCSKRRQQASFGARTSQPTLDDVGEATLRYGVARVALASDFANAIDSNKPYVVLLTPEGDASLYVASRSANGFEVREVGGGRSSVGFAYRIVAKPFGVKDERLPFKTTSDPNRKHR